MKQPVPFQIAYALRESLREGYSLARFRADLGAGLVVGIVALPLSMALAIASGVPPQYGLYTAIVAGGLVAMLGGSRTQVSGPTAAFVILLAPISATYGLAGLAFASMLAGVIMLLFGIFRFGKLIEFIPYPVTIGFTAGIAIVIATLQLNDLFGLGIAAMPEHFIEKVEVLAKSTSKINTPDVIIGAATLVLLIVWPRLLPKIPPALASLVIVSLAAVAIERIDPGFSPATIADRFSFTVGEEVRSGVPNLPPLFALPWNLPGPGGERLALDWETFRALLMPAFAIAILGSIESLLSAVIADGITGHRHNSDAELSAQGVANIVAPFFGGFAATGALARTAVNIRAGAQTPIAAVIHAIFILASILMLAPLLGYLPMAGLAALLLVVAWRMSEARHVLHVIRLGPKSDGAVLVLCLGLTVIFDMVVAVSVGVVMASILFMRRMAEVGGVNLMSDRHPEIDGQLPPGVLIYQIAGPLFFGAAQKAMSALRTLDTTVTCVVFDLENVPAMDATGLVNLRSAIHKLRSRSIRIILGGVRTQPMKILRRAAELPEFEGVVITRSMHEAIELATQRNDSVSAV